MLMVGYALGAAMPAGAQTLEQQTAEIERLMQAGDVAKATELAMKLSQQMQEPAVSDADSEKWLDAKVVKYHVEGVHKGREQVVGKTGDDEYGKAEVADRITVDFTWDFRESDAAQLVGELKLDDGKTQIADLRSDGTDCGPPQLNGEYEHFQSVKSELSADLITLIGTRRYPAAGVSNYPAGCSLRQIPGGEEEVQVFLGVMEPQPLGVPASMLGTAVTVSEDHKSFTVEGASGWVWTYTPTLLE
jgi:hypothetical protein